MFWHMLAILIVTEHYNFSMIKLFGMASQHLLVVETCVPSCLSLKRFVFGNIRHICIRLI